MSVYLREIDIDDAEILLEWRNDPATRENCFSKDVIDLESHMRWFKNKLSDENCLMFMLMDGVEPVGQLRIDKINAVGEIGYMVAPHRRKCGFGKKIIEFAETVATNDIKVLIGLVENSNEPSKKCFEANKYSELRGGGVFCAISNYYNKLRFF